MNNPIRTNKPVSYGVAAAHDKLQQGVAGNVVLTLR
jgi:hypothetical protein